MPSDVTFAGMKRFEYEVVDGFALISSCIPTLQPASMFLRMFVDLEAVSNFVVQKYEFSQRRKYFSKLCNIHFP